MEYVIRYFECVTAGSCTVMNAGIPLVCSAGVVLERDGDAAILY